MIDAKLAPYGALLLRVSIGALFILHGAYLKAAVFGMAGTAKYFASLGLPDWFAWVALLFAAYLGHGANGWLFTAKGGGYEYPVFWAIACFTLALLGSGAHALGDKPK